MMIRGPKRSFSSARPLTPEVRAQIEEDNARLKGVKPNFEDVPGDASEPYDAYKDRKLGG